jgi:hypothetical protein
VVSVENQPPPSHARWRECQQILQRFEDAWIAGLRPVPDAFLPEDLTLRALVLPDLLCVDLARRLKGGEPARVESYLERYPHLAGQADAMLALLRVEFKHCQRQRPTPTIEEYCQRFAYLAERLRQSLADRPSGTDDSGTGVADTGSEMTPAADGSLPSFLGRYPITAKLGEGSFGVVYRAYDEELRQPVAIKEPHRRRIASSADVETFLAEAQIVATLDHPHIVPVYDVGRTGDGLCYVVSKFVEGSDLKARIAEGPLPPPEKARLVAAVAEALHHAHRHRLVHRDVKPANILLDTAGKP